MNPPLPTPDERAPAPDATSPDPKSLPPLSPEEQLEEFAKKLKEEDWGHQPC